jgi:predicted nucleic acid-binding protein
MSRRIASMVLAYLAINACGTQDRETNVHKLTLATTEAACVAAGGIWNAPAPEKIVSAAGRPISQFDGVIASIARSRGATLATRNAKGL